VRTPKRVDLAHLHVSDCVEEMVLKPAAAEVMWERRTMVVGARERMRAFFGVDLMVG
jgi:hypothetical protein